MSDVFASLTVEELTAARQGAMKIGPFGSQLRKEEMVAHGVKVYGQENVIADDWTLGDRRISSSKYSALSSCELEPGDVVVSMMGTAGKCAVFPTTAERGIMDSHLLRVQPNLDLIEREYFAIVLQAENIIGRQVAAMSHGSIMAGLSSKIVKEFRIPVPPLVEQPKIVEVLGTVDTAIWRTETLIDKLKAVKQGLLHDLLTRGIDVNGQLRPPQSEAPQLYKKSPLGWIPREWDAQLIAALLTDIEAGKSPSCSDTPAPSGSWGVLKVSAVHSDGFRSDQNKLVEHESLVNPAYEVHPGDLLITRANTPELVGMACLVKDPQPKLMLCDKTLRLVVNCGMASKEYLCLCLQQPYIRSQIECSATGTSMSMKNISQHAIRNLLVAIAPLPEQIEISARANTLALRLQHEMAVLEKLRQQKAGLMDDLLTGRVRVTSLQDSVQQAATLMEA